MSGTLGPLGFHVDFECHFGSSDKRALSLSVTRMTHGNDPVLAKVQFVRDDSTEKATLEPSLTLNIDPIENRHVERDIACSNSY
jgi:hypothetical protein